MLDPSEITESDIKLDTISFEWVKSCSKVNQLKKAYRLLEADGTYPLDNSYLRLKL